MKARLHRICALALCLALLAALALPAMALQADDWALPELEQASQAGILPASLESADLTQRLTRQEMCQVVVHTLPLNWWARRCTPPAPAISRIRTTRISASPRSWASSAAIRMAHSRPMPQSPTRSVR